MAGILKHIRFRPKNKLEWTEIMNTLDSLSNEPIDFAYFIPYKEKIDSGSTLS